MWCVYLPFGLLLSALETIFFWYFLILDHLLIDDIFKVATRIKIKAGFRKNRFCSTAKVLTQDIADRFEWQLPTASGGCKQVVLETRK